MRLHQPIAIDSAALISLLSKEPPIAALIRYILSQLEARKGISTVSLVEMTIRLAIAGEDQGIVAIQRDFAELPDVTFVDFDQRRAIEAAYVRVAIGLKLPNTVIVATARLASETALIGNDRQWRNKPLGVAYNHMDDILALV